MNNYPAIKPDTIQDMQDILRAILKERVNDVVEAQNYKNIFISGRKVGKIPAGSTDVSATDNIGDFNYDANYLYLCVDNSGATWRRVALATW